MGTDTKSAFDVQLLISERKGVPFGSGKVCLGVIRNTVTGKMQIKQAGGPLDTLSKFRGAGILGDIRESNGVQCCHLCLFVQAKQRGALFIRHSYLLIKSLISILSSAKRSRYSS